MADGPDILGAWRDLTKQITGLAGSVAGQAAGPGRDLLGPLQRQAELIEQVLRRQIELEQELVRRAVAPAQAVADALESAPDARRGQATAFRPAAPSSTQAAALLDAQPLALEQTLASLRLPKRLL